MREQMHEWKYEVQAVAMGTWGVNGQTYVHMSQLLTCQVAFVVEDTLSAYLKILTNHSWSKHAKWVCAMHVYLCDVLLVHMCVTGQRFTSSIF